MRKTLFSALIILSLSFTIVTSTTAAKPTGSRTYVLVFHENLDPEEAAHGIQNQYGIVLSGIYKYALKGAAVQASPRQIAEIQNDDRVLLIEQNQTYSIAEQITPTGIQRVFADGNPNLSIDSSDAVRVDADVAILDTGIDFDHPDLNLYTAIDCTLSGPLEGTCAGTRDDGHGHGTHVAGTVGALDNDYGVVGVAPGVRLWAVKVLTNYGTGTTAQIVAGIDYVAAHADEIEVANMSLGGSGESVIMDQAISGAVGLGVTFSLAAGNLAKDVNDYHPAGSPDAITVSALADFDGLPDGLAEPTCRDDTDDTLVYFSNYGEGVDITAPGTCIYSTYFEGGYATMSGTSMAAPHVAGAAAILASTGLYTPAEIKTTLLEKGNYDWLDDSGDDIQEPLLDLSNSEVFAPVMSPNPPPIELKAVGYRRSGWQYTDLTWTGAASESIDVYRDGALVAATDNIDDYTDEKIEKGAGMHFYRICESGGQTVCSNTVIVYY
jgi:subtilisin